MDKKEGLVGTCVSNAHRSGLERGDKVMVYVEKLEDTGEVVLDVHNVKVCLNLDKFLEKIC